MNFLLQSGTGQCAIRNFNVGVGRIFSPRQRFFIRLICQVTPVATNGRLSNQGQESCAARHDVTLSVESEIRYSLIDRCAWIHSHTTYFIVSQLCEGTYAKALSLC